jgi:predicted ATP-binding protein involved in virulence
MKVHKVQLVNFRLFDDTTIQFPAAFTVLIGENGRGKSAILHGLRVALGGWLQGFKETKALSIQQEDVRRIDLGHRFVPQLPTTVHAWCELSKSSIDWSRKKNTLTGRTLMMGAATLTDFTQYLEKQTNEYSMEVDFPVLAYFSTARLWVESKEAVNFKTKGFKIRDGYAHCLENTHDRRTALSWIKSSYYKSLKAQKRSVATEHEAEVLLPAVLEAITTCVPGWSDLEWDEDTDDLAGLYKRPDGTRELVPLYYLSDGQRTMAGMVAEIAYRCVILNGHLGENAVRNSRGIVLIDELDMHLHPNWQRQVVGDLKAAFPNLQFIATTHSPFIVQSLETAELINLDYPTDLRPKDLRLDDVAETVMGVESILSEEKELIQQQTTNYLQHLQQSGRRAEGQLLTPEGSNAQLTALENSIADPGLRALLRMKRLAQGNSEQ